MTAFLFPGQGSQQKGMGNDLFDKYKELTDQADALLGYSIKKLCLENPNNELAQTQFTQPALYTVGALMYLETIDKTRKKPDYVAGHSVGEYCALFAAGAFDFVTGLKLVQKRGELMSKAKGGGMAAVIGLSEENITQIIRSNNLETLSIANDNSMSQIVIAGPKADVESAKPIFEKAGAMMYIMLNVSGAFHSPYMQTAADEFARYTEKFELLPLSIPVISNVSARPYRQEDIKRNLINQITSLVKWTESIRYLMGKGEVEFREIGPGNVLTKLVNQIKKDAKPLIIEEESEPAINRKKDDPASIRHAETRIMAESLGDEEFKKDYKIKYAYAAGAMYMGIASPELVVRMGNAGLIAFLGTGGLEKNKIEDSIKYIQQNLINGGAYGVNILSHPNNPEKEEILVDMLMRLNVRNVEAAAYMRITPALVRYRLKGLHRDSHGKLIVYNRIIGKISRPEIAEYFLSPAPDAIVKKLLEEKQITQEEADCAAYVPMADDLCAEADSGGHTDGAAAYALLPSIIRMRDEMMLKYRYAKRIRVGSAGGIGTPEAAAASFILGADFIVTGSINQCTVEAGTSDLAKDLLAQMNIQDTDYAPAGDMFELGAKVQVLTKGLFFSSRANKLYDIYRHHDSIDDIDAQTKKQLQEKYFKRSFEDIYRDCKAYYPPQDIEKAERIAKYKMALIFKWYFGHSTRVCLAGKEENKVDFQILCGPALGAFNNWVKGTDWEDWRNRHVDEIGIKLMHETAAYLREKFHTLIRPDREWLSAHKGGGRDRVTG